MPRPVTRTSWEAWALAASGIALLLAWGIFGEQGIYYLLGIPILVIAWLIFTRAESPSLYIREIDADFERIRLERARRWNRLRSQRRARRGREQ